MKRLVILISLLLILTSFKSPKNNTKTISVTKSPATIALINHKLLYFVRLHLNNKEAILLVDTGAAKSLLDINQANDYKFKFKLTNDNLTGLGGESNKYKLSNYSFGHEKIKLNIFPFGADLNHINEVLGEELNVVGILGSDFFRSNNAVIDYKNQKLIINN